METSATVHSENLDDLGVDTQLQAELRSVAEEISSNVKECLKHSEDGEEWEATADFIPATVEEFVRELKIAYPIYSFDSHFLKMSFISRNDGRYWQFRVSKSAFLIIREILASQKG